MPLRMVSFKTPIFPYSFETVAPVDVVLQQDGRVIGTLKYYYMSTCNVIGDF